MDDEAQEMAASKTGSRGNFFKLGLLCGLLLGALVALLIRQEAEPELAEMPEPAAASPGPPL